ncbi:MAG: DegV family protein [Acholeplasmatales bacterium]|nr:DegV family protein [Acholeplasmatales bacterium]
MEKIAIMCDSMAEISQEEAEELGIKVIPMPFMINGEEYLEGVSLDSDTFFKMLEEDANVSTSQPSIAYVASIWDELLEENDTIVYIPMSSGLSKSCESAMVEAEKNYKDRVFVVDAKRISSTLRQIIYDAMHLRELGYSAREIKDILTEVRSQSKIYIMLDTLYFLKKGGRITPAAAALGGMLKLKPVLMINGEKLDKYKMRNRSLENGIEIMIDAAKKTIEELKEIDGRVDNIRYEIAYASRSTESAEKLEKRMREEFGKDIDILIDRLALAVACHTGEGAVGLAVTKKLPDKYTKKICLEEGKAVNLAAEY